MQHHWHNPQMSIPFGRVSRLTNVVPRQSVFHIEVHIQDVVNFVLLENALQFSIFATNRLRCCILRVEPLLAETHKNAPSPVDQFGGGACSLVGNHLDANHAPCPQEGNHVFRLGHNMSNLVTHLLAHLLQSAFAADDLLVRHGAQFVELLKSFGESLSHFGEQAFGLKLVETLHDDVFGADVLNAHHIQKHVVAEVEGRVQRV